MSLVVWLPLNGNLENQGLSNVTVTNNGATVDNNGKIGKCYSFNGSSNYITISSFSVPENFSISIWGKWNSLNNWSRLIDFGSATSGTGYGFLIANSTTSSNMIFAYECGSGSVNMDIGTIVLNTWYHIVITFQGTNIKIYLNGTLVKTVTSAASVGGHTLNYNYLGKSNWSQDALLNGKLNDFRIYDHCLSPKEVKELAKGLVLHYRLAGPGQENLVKDSNKKIISGDYAVTSYKLSEALVLNQIYTITMKAKLTPDLKWIGIWSDGGGTMFTDCQARNENNFYKWTVTCNSSNATHNIFTIFASNNNVGVMQGSTPKTGTCEIEWIKLEKGSIATPWCPSSADALYSTMGYNNNIEYDCSGYRRNGTKSGTITWDIDSPRYATSYSALSDYPIKAEVNMPSCDSMTVSFWTKITTFGTAKSGLFATSNISTDPTDYNDTAMAQRDSDIDLKGVSGSNKIFNFTAPSTGQWHHCVFVYDGSKVYYYQDGKKINEEACAIGALKSYQYFYLGYSKAGGVVRKTLGKWSDLRIYATALSAEDIAELYHSAVIVDNTGKSYAYEYFEA